ncbi:MBL fold metallo-hydrolase [Caulobacter sp. S45]|uniref:MBL fold metallo-hydrolase n=1 Tax=Caulobacter sp. S45 TaxID=1641861 RepID=UPI0015751E02|nr:MBL fold metallo-hydrolase [Caulobacter sp. S45]
MSGRLRFTILGCGSSGGVPRADGVWGRCDPAEAKNRRSRCSMLVQKTADQPDGPETTVLIDTSPDLRYQTSAAEVRRLDAVLYTHDHADQAHGIDDLRVFFLTSRKRTPCYMDPATTETLMRRFDYIFETRSGYPAICDPRVLPPHHRPWSIEGPSGAIPILNFDQDHGSIRSVGYRIGPVGYCSDVVALPPSAMAALAGVEVFIVDALRDTPHPTHANVAMALAWIAELKPARGVLTNLHSDLDYNELSGRLPPGVEPAYDGMVIETDA